MADVMLDIETKAKSANSIVATIGAVKFDRNGQGTIGQGIHIYLDLDQQAAMGRETDPDTMSWWDKQNPAVRDDVFRADGRVSVEAAISQLTAFVKGADRVWAQGPLFDMKIVEHLCDNANMPAPWRFGQVRDSRTLFDVLGDTRSKHSNELHNAMLDAKNQAVAAQHCFRRIALLKRVENIAKTILFWR